MMVEQDRETAKVEASVLELFDGRFQGIVAISAKREGITYTSVYSCDPLRLSPDDAQKDADSMVDNFLNVFEEEHGFGLMPVFAPAMARPLSAPNP